MTKTVGEYIADDWMDGTQENSQEDIEAAIRDFALQLAIRFEVAHGDDAVLSLTEMLRETAEAIETRTGKFIQRDLKRRSA